MERANWLKEKRRLAEVRYDMLFARDYDQQWGTITPSHREMVERFLALCPPAGCILDAACGTGKYWTLVLASGRSLLGIDQSQQMVLRARAKFPSAKVEKLGLQELHYIERFDGLMCIDAMENIFPEDWPFVLGNFCGALRSAGLLYLTVELAEPEALQQAYRAGRRLGLPLIAGEWAHEGGYHYYPPLEQVHAWLREADFALLEEREGDGYQHVLARKHSSD